MSKQKERLPGATAPLLRISGGAGDVIDAFAADMRARGANPEHCLFVADENTLRAAGAVAGAFCERVILPAGVKARLALAEKLAGRAKGKTLFAAGAGTVNDICKYAAYLNGTEYACFPTALSMNGYVSSVASLIDAHGHKTSFAARPPFAAYFLPSVSRDAPAALSRAGMADTLCYLSCLNDMRIARRFTGADVPEALFDMQRAAVREVYKEEAEAAPGAPLTDAAVIRRFHLIILSGAAMNAYGSSAPASQSEHMLCHLYDSAFPRNRLLHGEKTGMFARYTLRLQRQYTRLCGDGEEKDREMFRKYYQAAVAQGVRAAPGFFPGRTLLRRTGEGKLRRLVTVSPYTGDAVTPERASFRRAADQEALALFERACYTRLPRGAEKIIASPAFLSRDRFTVLDVFGLLS